jgi:hypothetical protein
MERWVANDMSKEYDTFNSAMDTILRADSKAVKQAMEEQKQVNAKERIAKGQKKRGRKRVKRLQVELTLDPAEMQGQIEAVAVLLKSRFPDGIPDEIAGRFLGAVEKLAFTKFRTTTVANGTIKIIQACGLLGDFESITTAILTSGGHVSHKPIT